MHWSRIAPSDALEAMQWRERWRFLPAGPDALNDDELVGMHGASAGLPSAAPTFDDWVDCKLDAAPPEPPSAGQRPLRHEVHCCGRVPVLPTSLVYTARWKLVALGRWVRTGAIHCKEARAAPLGLAREARNMASYNKRLFALGDNLAEVLAFDRGRARDVELLALARRAAGLQLVMGMRWHRRYIETARNPSGRDSHRSAELRLRPGQRVLGALTSPTPLVAALGPRFLEAIPIEMLTTAGHAPRDRQCGRPNGVGSGRRSWPMTSSAPGSCAPLEFRAEFDDSEPRAQGGPGAPAASAGARSDAAPIAVAAHRPCRRERRSHRAGLGRARDSHGCDASAADTVMGLSGRRRPRPTRAPPGAS